MNKKKIIGCLIARTNSNRLPKKVLKKISNLSMIEHIILRMKQSKKLDDIYLCTSTHEDDAILLEIADKMNIKSYAGSEDSVIDRMLDVAEKENADVLVRVTGDNIFTDEVIMDRMIDIHLEKNADYTRCEYLPTGITAEAISTQTLKKCYKLIDPNTSEYLTLYIFDPNNFKCCVVVPPDKLYKPNWTLTVDTPEDFKRTEFIYKYINKKIIHLNNIVELSKREEIPHLISLSEGEVKLPGNKMMSLKEFKQEHQNKIDKSENIKITDNIYDEN